MTTTFKQIAVARRLRLVVASSLIVVLAGCGSSDGTRPSISATLPPDASIARPEQPSDTEAVAPPAETAAPETQPPAQPLPQPEETQPAEQPEETAAPNAEPSDTVAPAEDGDGTVWWPWVLAAIVVVAAIIAIARRRRSGPSWQGQATSLLDEIDQLTSHLVAITPDGVRTIAQTDAMRLATMRAALRDVVTTAPNSASRAMFDELTAPTAALHGALDAIAMSVDPTAVPDVATVSQVAMRLHTASASVRAGLSTHH